jgi:hypothetical protein
MEVGGTGSGSCSVANLGTRGVKPSEPVSHIDKHYTYFSRRFFTKTIESNHFPVQHGKTR